MAKDHAIHKAINQGNLERVRSLLDSDSSLANVPTTNGIPPAHLAVQKNYVEILRLLLRHGAEVDGKNPNNESSLHIAVQGNNAGMVCELLRNGANVNAKAIGLGGLTPLHLAADNPDSSIAELLIREGAHLESASTVHEQPIHSAAKKNNVRLIHLLLNKGVDINSLGQFSWTPLHYAAYDGGVDVTEVLIARGANLEVTDVDGNTPLHLSFRQLPPKGSAILGLLLQGGATLDIFSATRLRQTNIVHLLLQENSELIRTSPGHKDLLSAAIRSRQKELVQLLITHGADVNASGYFPIPLMEALTVHDTSLSMTLVRLLLDHGADPRIRKGPNTQSPLEWASENNRELLKLLKQHRKIE